MTSEPTSAFVWIWLPGADEPVACGRIDAGDEPHTFTYGRRYLERSDAVPIFEPELPLRTGPQTSASGTRLPLCIDDAMPDSWGRRVIQYRRGETTAEYGEITYLLDSGSNRIGALDFQTSATDYVPRESDAPSLKDLYEAADAVIAGKENVDQRLIEVLINGTLIGGARPKAVLTVDGRQLIAKFSTSTDTFPWVQSEYVAMELAHRAGLRVARVEIVRLGDRYALVIERFDRIAGTGERCRMVSALTILGYNTWPDGRYATYVQIAHAIRKQFEHPNADLRELFARISFNILCGNTDDHGRNHAAFVNPQGLELTPGYDIAPQPRSGRTAAQALAFDDDGNRDARTDALLDAAGIYHLDRDDAQSIIEEQIDVIRNNWGEVCDRAELTDADRQSLMGLQFLNEHALGSASG